MLAEWQFSASVRWNRRWRVHATQNPCVPVDSVQEFVTEVVVGGGVFVHEMQLQWLVVGRGTFSAAAVSELLGLAVYRYYDGAVETVGRPHTDLRVGAVGHDREKRWVVDPLLEDLHAADG